MPILGVNRCHSPEPVCKYSPDLGSSYKLQRMLSALRDRCGLQGHFTNGLPITINVSSSTHDHHVPVSSGVTGKEGHVMISLMHLYCQCRGQEHQESLEEFWLLLHCVFPARGHVLVNISSAVSHLTFWSERRGDVMQYCDCRAGAEWLIDESFLLQQFYGPGTHSVYLPQSQCSLSRPLELLPTSRANCRDIGPGIKHGPVRWGGLF